MSNLWIVKGTYHFTSKGTCYQEYASIEVSALSEDDASERSLGIVRAHIRRDFRHISQVLNLRWISCEIVPGSARCR
jgi:hypothetical protein